MRARLLPSLVIAVAFVALLVDGTVTASPADGSLVPDETRSISYFPARGGWTLMWTRFDPDAIDRDFGRVAGLGANTVRVIVPAHAFGYPEPEPVMTGRLERVVDIAAGRGLRVELTLFDWWHAYADLAGSRRWAAAVLSPYAGDARIAFVELKNELRPQDEGASAWAAALIPYVRELTGKPVTISVPALEPARDLGLLRSALGTAQPDFYSAHFYWRPELLAAHLDAARAAVAPLPLRLARDGVLDRSLVRHRARSARVAVRARGAAGLLSPFGRGRRAPARAPSHCAVGAVGFRARRDPRRRSRGVRQRAGVPLRPVPDLR